MKLCINIKHHEIICRKKFIFNRTMSVYSIPVEFLHVSVSIHIALGKAHFSTKLHCTCI